MVSFTRLVLIAGSLLSLTHAASVATCNGALGVVASVFAQYPEAQAFCSSRYPQTQATIAASGTVSTITVTVTVGSVSTRTSLVTSSVTIGTNTNTVTAAAATVTTVGTPTTTVVVSIATQTNSVTSVTTTVSTTTSTVTITQTDTQTSSDVATTTLVAKKRRQDTSWTSKALYTDLTNLVKKQATTTSRVSSTASLKTKLLGFLVSAPLSVVSKICSCVPLAGSTSKSTSTLTVTSTLTPTGVVTVTSTVTVSVTANVGVTVTPMSTVTVTPTSISTSVSTSTTETTSIITSTDIVTTLTTSTSTTTTSTTVTTTATVAPSCSPGLRCSPGGYRYIWHCGEIVSSGNNANPPVSATNAEACQAVCDNDLTCTGWSFLYETRICTTYSPLDEGNYTTQQDPLGVWALYVSGDCPL